MLFYMLYRLTFPLAQAKGYNSIKCEKIKGHSVIVAFKGVPYGIEWGCVRGSSDWTSVRKRFSTERVLGHWNRLPREVVMALSLSEFREYLDIALSHMVYFQVVLQGAGSWAWQSLWVPFNSKDSGILCDTLHVKCGQISHMPCSIDRDGVSACSISAVAVTGRVGIIWV